MKFLFYSPDTYGLGHVRRTISVAGHVLGVVPGASALVLTGAPRAHYFTYPERCDYVKLPSLSKDDDGAYVTREIGMPVDATLRLRARLILDATTSFEPDVVVVDHAPGGVRGEILPALAHVSRHASGALRVLGLRDVLDEPAAVREAWAREGIVEILRHHYDLILVYGQKDVFDPVEAYGIPQDVATKVVYAGYIHRNGAKLDAATLRGRFAPRTGRLVVVTAGGGGDGDVAVRAFLRAVAGLGAACPFESVIVTGPLMSPGKRARLKAAAAKLPGVALFEYHEDIPALYRAADVAVSMGGYNSICELACTGSRAVIVARSFPRREQILRASLLERRGVLRCIDAASITPELLREAVLERLHAPSPPRRWGLDFGGLEATSREIAARAGAFR